MSKTTKRLLSAILVILVCFVNCAGVLVAKESSGTLQFVSSGADMSQGLSAEQIARYNDWVCYDRLLQQYAVKREAIRFLGKKEYFTLCRQIQDTNKVIRNLSISSMDLSVITPEQEYVAGGLSSSIMARAAYKEGVTKAEVHWWGLTIYLSKTAVNRIGAGLAIGGIWVPEKVVSGVLATLGVVATQCPGGIAFDVNMAAAALTGGVTLGLTSNPRWQ